MDATPSLTPWGPWWFSSVFWTVGTIFASSRSEDEMNEMLLVAMVFVLYCAVITGIERKGRLK